MQKNQANYLSSVRNFYGFRTKGNTIAAILLSIVGTLLFGYGFAVCQIFLFALGIYLSKKYP